MPITTAPRLANGQWQKTFPLQMNTETLSLVFVKKLFAVAVSNVAFVRKLFPDNAFFDKNIEGISLKILKEEASCPGTCKVVFWLRGCFDAIERRYLRKATLVLYENPGDPKTIMESFSFTFRYDSKEGASMEMEAEPISSAKFASTLPRDERVKVQTKNLLNAILAAGKMLGPLPKKMMLTMKLQYYNSAPSDYMPNGFRIDENPEMVFQSDPVNLKIGSIDTNGDLGRSENGAISAKGKRGKHIDVDGLTSAAEELQITNNTVLNIVFPFTSMPLEQGSVGRYIYVYSDYFIILHPQSFTLPLLLASFLLHIVSLTFDKISSKLKLSFWKILEQLVVCCFRKTGSQNTWYL
ncbi:HORMA domain-containing protein 2 [Echinococcus granulosus]|uniref:HORMA domain-containing protein 2 n=1 Tax=Echinococcus granulosus TaxID=6210 RepID=W6UDP2_ECHGR|nr:HORMA domain-containing protein 2 [Echinococcus granulosus]EUB59445.1 HORMA domain-containing protein 2 [Echinococcus granulosus]